MNWIPDHVRDDTVSMVSIRLSRVGKRNSPAFRLIVQEKSRSPFSKNLEILGSYLPTRTPKVVQFNVERIKYWLSKGAQPSETVHNMFVAQGIIEGKKKSISSITKKRAAKIKAAKPKEEVKQEAPAPEATTETPAA